MLFRNTFAALALTGVLAVTPVAQADDIVETAAANEDFSTLVAAVKAAGLVETLQGDGPFTVFAPTNDAFAKLPEGTIPTLLKPENKDQLTSILTYHVAPAKVMAADVVKLKFAPTVNGQKAPVTVADGAVKIGDATVVKTDIVCDNGVIHVIDAVLLPESKNLVEVAAGAGSFETLIAAAKAAGLAGALTGDGPLTVFAPTDDAFAKLPEGTVATLLKPENKETLVAILKNHVVAGAVYSDAALKAGEATTLGGGTLPIAVKNGAAYVGVAKLVKTDVPASNGVIHVIDTVLVPTDDEEEGAMTPPQARRMLETVVADGAAKFNHGDHAGCAAAYMTAANEIVAAGDALPPQTVRVMRTALKDASAHSCPTARSWRMRTAIDTAHAQLAAH